jgi:hypothetical protein
MCSWKLNVKGINVKSILRISNNSKLWALSCQRGEFVKNKMPLGIVRKGNIAMRAARHNKNTGEAEIHEIHEIRGEVPKGKIPRN